MLLKDGEMFMVGNVRFDVLHTPGHTPEHVSFLLTDTAGADRLVERVLNEDVIVIDVRNESEWAEERLPSATHIMLGYLPERAEEIINSKPIVVQCRTGARSAIGASILKATGAREVINMQGGLRDWAAAGLPVEN